MYILAVSGGPDSMYLLNKYKKKNIVVAHVNYNMRPTALRDQKIVEDFCTKNDIPFRVYELNSKLEGNFQSGARDLRYTFFKKIYDEFSATQLLTAHHKDDFLETAIMQSESQREPTFFGIRKKSDVFHMNVYRPLINKKWKQEIIDYLDNHKINYGIDESNTSEKYSRNKIRNSLLKQSLSEKKKKYSWYRMSNKILQKKNKVITNTYNQWKNLEFEKQFIVHNNAIKERLIFILINENFSNIKLSKSKIISIYDFIISNEGNKIFILDSDNYIFKLKNKLYFNEQPNT